MAQSAESAHAIPTAVALPAIRVPAWAWLMVVLAVFVLYLALQDNGALLSSSASFMHEFTHDGRHALGLPCH